MRRAMERAAEQAWRGADHALGRVDAARRLPLAASRAIDDAERRLAHAGALLNSYSYERVLDRGFVLVRGPDGPITDATAATPGLTVTLQFRENQTRDAIIQGDAEPSAEQKKPARKKRAGNSGDGRQGSLL